MLPLVFMCFQPRRSVVWQFSAHRHFRLGQRGAEAGLQRGEFILAGLKRRLQYALARQSVLLRLLQTLQLVGSGLQCLGALVERVCCAVQRLLTGLGAVQAVVGLAQGLRGGLSGGAQAF